MKLVHRIMIVAASYLAAGALSGAAHAQVMDLNCNPERDSDKIFAEEQLSIHAGYKFIVGMQRGGCSIVNKVRDLVGTRARAQNPSYDTLPEPQKKSLFDRLFSTEDVVDAATPNLIPSRAMKANDEATDRLLANYRAAKSPGAVATILPDGSYYEGALKAGKPDGPGTLIEKDGAIWRGRFVAGELNGQGQTIQPNGGVQAGKIVNAHLVAGAKQLSDGSAIVAGLFDENGLPKGLAEITRPDGSSRKAYYRDGADLTAGPSAPAGQEPELPPLPPGETPDPPTAVPVWSPSAPTGQLIEYTMKWGRDDPGSMLHLASMDPAFKDNHFAMFAFCQPLMGQLTAEEKADCGIKDDPSPAQAGNGCGPGGAGPASPVGGLTGPLGAMIGGRAAGAMTCAPAARAPLTPPPRPVAQAYIPPATPPARQLNDVEQGRQICAREIAALPADWREVNREVAIFNTAKSDVLFSYKQSYETYARRTESEADAEQRLHPNYPPGAIHRHDVYLACLFKARLAQVGVLVP